MEHVMFMFFQKPYGAPFLFPSIMVASEYLCHISRLPCAWWRNTEYSLVHTVFSGSSDAHGSTCLNEAHRLLEEVKIIQSELLEAIGFHIVTPFNTYWWKYSICGTAHGGTSRGGTSCITHPRETVGEFRCACPISVVVPSQGVGRAAALLCPAVAQRSEKRLTLVQSIKQDHIPVT